MSRNIASGGGYRYYTGSSRQEDNYDDGHGISIISAAGAGNGSACGTGNCRFSGHSYQNYFENCGDLSGIANGYGYASFSGDAYLGGGYEED